MWQSIPKIKTFTVTVCLLLGIGSCAQIVAQVTEASVARKFDEYGRINGEDQSARLDNYAIQLQNEPLSGGYVIAYGPEGKGGGTGQSILDIIKEYLVEGRGIPSDRLQFVYAGRNSDLSQPKVELWIRPPTAPAPAHIEHATNITTFKGMIGEIEGWDDIPITTRFEDCCGPPVPDVKSAAFADLLSQQKNARGYIVAYNGADAMPGAWKRVAEKEMEDLKKRGVDAGRLKIIFGGVAKSTSCQLWLTANGAPQPVKEAGPERPPAKAIELGTYFPEELGDEKNVKAIFDRISESLYLQPTLRAYLVIQYGSRVDDTETSTSTGESPIEEPANQGSAEPPTPEVTPADIPVVIENWRKQLRSKQKIGENRFVVVHTSSRDFEGQRLQVWLVPRDQPLPEEKF